MYELVMDYKCEIVKVTCVEWNEVKTTIERSKKRWPEIVIVGILNKDYMKKEKLELTFKGVR